MAKPASLPIWIKVWLVFSSLVCTWDAGYLWFRPHSATGGKYHWMWKIYDTYTKVDRRYKNTDDSYLYAAAVLNLVEVVLNLLVVYLSVRKCRYAALLVFTVSTMTLWKTILYLLQYSKRLGAGRHVNHVQSAYDYYVILFGTKLLWVFMPLLVMCAVHKRLLNRVPAETKQD